MVKSLAALFSAEDNFIIACHVQPDGDGTGSSLALGRFLEQAGKQVRFAFAKETEIPPQYRFLPGADRLRPVKGSAENAVFVALDCANIDRLGDLKDIALASRVLVNIDHHPDNSTFGGVNLVETGASATAEIVYDVLRELESIIQSDIALCQDNTITYKCLNCREAVIDAETALCLYVGIVTDTGRFQYTNTTPKVLRTAAKLIEIGVDPNVVFQNIYERNSLPWLKIVGRGLEKAVYLPELNFIYSAVTANDFKDTGASPGETENLVDWLRSLDGAAAAAVLKETKDGKIKVSLRSQGDLSVGAIANSLNGGGHRNAAGYIAEGSLDDAVKSLIEAIESQRVSAKTKP